MKKFLKMTIVFFMLLSSVTLVSAEETVQDDVVYAKHYGVDPSGIDDSTIAIQRMLEDVQKLSEDGKQRTIKFEKGHYKITKEHALEREVHTSNTSSVDFPVKKIGFLIENQKNLIIDGGNSQFMIHGDMMSVAVMQSENIKLKNMSIDYQVATTSEMTIYDFDANNNTVDYYIPSTLDYELTNNGIKWLSEQKENGDYYWTEYNEHSNNYGVQIKYPTEQMGRSYHTHVNPFNSLRSIKKLDNNLVRITYNTKPPFEYIKGMNFQLVSNAVRPTAGAFIFESKDVDVINTQISYLHGFGFLVQMAENVKFDGVHFETDVETGLNTSSYADGIHVSGAKGKIEVVNSFFNNTHDDPINIHGTFTRVDEKIDNHTLRIKYIHHQQGGFQQFYEGDKVLFYSRDTLESSDQETEYTVKSVRGPQKGNLKEMIVEFEEELPSYLTEKVYGQPKYVAENITYTPEVTIKNNDFRNVFTRMILVTSRKKVIIEDNTFEAPTMPTLFFSNDSDEWYESGPIRDLEIRNNTFNVRNIGRTWWKYAPAIYVHPVTLGKGFPSADNPIHKNILVEGNTFNLESDGAVRAESVENFTFRDNVINRFNPNVTLDITAPSTLSVNDKKKIDVVSTGNVVEGLDVLPGGPENNSGSVANVLEFEKSKNVVVEGNTFDDGLRQNILLEGMNPDQQTIQSDLKVLTSRQKVAPTKPVGKVLFSSSNPEVAHFDEEGNLLAKKEGSVTVYAYYHWNDTIIKSEPKTITIENQARKENLEFEEDILEFQNIDQHVTLSIKGHELNDLEYHVVNPDVVDVVEGVVTAKATGITEVAVQSATAQGTFIAIVNNPEDQIVNNPIIKTEGKDASYKITENNISFNRKNGEDLWGSDNTLSNITTLDLNSIDRNNFTAVVTIDGLPARLANNWDSTYLSLMKLNNGVIDRDNYISIGKRAHADGIGIVEETNGNGKEAANNNADLNAISKGQFAISKQGKDVKMFYVHEDGTLETVYEADATRFGDEFTVAVVGWGAGQNNTLVSLSDIKLANGTVEEVLETQPLEHFVNDDQELNIDGLETDINGNTLVVSYPQDDSLNTYVILKDETGKLSLTKGSSVVLSQSGNYHVNVVGQKDSGKFSNVLSTELNYEKSDKAGKYLEGILLTDITTLRVPEDQKLLTYLNYDDSEVEFIDVTNLDQITLAGQTIEILSVKSNEAHIQEITVGTYELDDYDDKNSFFSVFENIDSLSLSVTLSEGTDSVSVSNDDHNILVDGMRSGNADTFMLPIHEGVNTFTVVATAKDGKTTDVKYVHVLKNNIEILGTEAFTVNQKPIKNNEVIDLKENSNKVDVDITAKNPLAQINYYQKVNDTYQSIDGIDIVDTDTTFRITIMQPNNRTLEALEFTVVNVGNPQDVIDVLARIEAMDLSSYTDDSVADLKVVVDHVKIQLDSGFSDIKAMKESLQEALDNLVVKPIIKPEQLETSELVDVLKEAQLILNDTTITVDKTELQELVDQATQLLEKAEVQNEELSAVRVVIIQDMIDDMVLNINDTITKVLDAQQALNQKEEPLIPEESNKPNEKEEASKTQGESPTTSVVKTPLVYLLILFSSGVLLALHRIKRVHE